jgi:ABC-2 type transport system ATP-binding protein
MQANPDSFYSPPSGPPVPQDSTPPGAPSNPAPSPLPRTPNPAPPSAPGTLGNSPQQPGPSLQAPSNELSEQPPAVRATWSGLGVRLGSRVLLEGFSYTVPDGGIVGVVGPSGPALTTTLLALAGRYRAISGTAEIAGAPESVVVASLAGQDEFDPLLTVEETVAETANATVHGTAQANANWSIAGAGLMDLMNREVGELTTGQRLRMSLAAAAATGANVIVLDAGPISGESDTAEIWQLLTQLATSGRLLLVGFGSAHPSMNLVISIQQPAEAR